MSTSPIKVIEKLIDAQDRIADFVANGPSDGLGGFVRDGYRTRCNQFANLPPWAQALGNGTTGTMSRICQPYWDDNGWDGPVSNSPFTGGQCAGVSYIVTWSITETLCSSGPVNRPQSNVTVTGPVARAKTEINPGSNPTVEFRIGTAGSTLPIRGSGSYINPCFADVTSALDWGNFSVVRADGMPDTCGDPEGSLEPGTNPPPDPGPIDAPDPTDDPSNPTGPPLLPLPPYDDPLGGPTPIDAPDDPVAPGPPESGPGSPDNVGDPIPVTPAGDEGEETDFGEPPTGKVWVGCLLNFTLPTNLGGIPGSAPANRVLARVFGNASLVFAGGRGIAYRQNSAWSYVLRPTGALKVTGVYVNCEPGITYTVRPISIEQCPENTCGA